jgi:hypothetical protein
MHGYHRFLVYLYKILTYADRIHKCESTILLQSGRKWVLIEHECMGPKLTQAEGFILGVGAKLFTIAGPVIVYGISVSVVYGLIYWICTKI